MSTASLDQKKPLEVVAVNISLLKEAEYNPRKITNKELQDIQNSIKEFGVVEPIVVNRFKGRENIIIGGHQRIKAFKKLGPPYVPLVPVVYVSLTYEKEKRLNVRLNKNTGQFDFQKLIEEFEMDELLDIGFEEDDFDELEMGIQNENENSEKEKKPIECPNCGETF